MLRGFTDFYYPRDELALFMQGGATAVVLRAGDDVGLQMSPEKFCESDRVESSQPKPGQIFAALCNLTPETSFPTVLPRWVY